LSRGFSGTETLIVSFKWKCLEIYHSLSYLQKLQSVSTMDKSVRIIVHIILLLFMYCLPHQFFSSSASRCLAVLFLEQFDPAFKLTRNNARPRPKTLTSSASFWFEHFILHLIFYFCFIVLFSYQLFLFCSNYIFDFCLVLWLKTAVCSFSWSF